MHKTWLILLMLCVLHLPLQAQEITALEATEIIAKLQADPYHKAARNDMFRLFDWMDKTEEVVIFLADERINKILDRKRPYKRHLYILMLGGMASYDLRNPNDNLELPEVDLADGYACMCAGYRNLLTQHKVKKDRYFKKLCR